MLEINIESGYRFDTWEQKRCKHVQHYFMTTTILHINIWCVLCRNIIHPHLITQSSPDNTKRISAISFEINWPFLFEGGSGSTEARTNILIESDLAWNAVLCWSSNFPRCEDNRRISQMKLIPCKLSMVSSTRVSRNLSLTVLAFHLW